MHLNLTQIQSQPIVTRTVFEKRNRHMLSSSVFQADSQHEESNRLAREIESAFEKMAPIWPLKDRVAVNPLRGLEEYDFEEAVQLAAKLFQDTHSYSHLASLNRETIKWCQAYLDEGQAVFDLPAKQKDFYGCFRDLVAFDAKVHQQNKEHRYFLAKLPVHVDDAIILCLEKLEIPTNDRAQFFLFLLSTLSGWAGHVHYYAKWRCQTAEDESAKLMHDFIAIRLILAVLLCPNIKTNFANFMNHIQSSVTTYHTTWLQELRERETAYRQQLLKNLNYESAKSTRHESRPLAQFVFCIDVRSEILRAAIEQQGNYATVGFAGFFGLPLEIKSSFENTNHASCPVLLQPQHQADQHLSKSASCHAAINRIGRSAYEALKYMFATPFLLVDIMGISAAYQMLRSMLISSNYLTAVTADRFEVSSMNLNIEAHIPFEKKCQYAESMLRMTGLTRQFAEVVVLCGHESKTENNAYQAMLDCGACGGHSGLPNASVMADILNDSHVRRYLAQQHISIPAKTCFIAAVHVTTTDAIHLHTTVSDVDSDLMAQLKNDLTAASQLCRIKRAQFTLEQHATKIEESVKRKSRDWSEVRPEWGLARNASFIIGPRTLTAGVELAGRSFLHSYDWQQDDAGEWLTAIMVAPLIVAQWINAQYFFSTLDNVAYGGGSKITQNIVGQFGVMQGNGSDLFSGLPLQSVNSDDHRHYHELQRLLVVVYAPKERVRSIFITQTKLNSLLLNRWINLVCIDPTEECVYQLTDHLEWLSLSQVGEEVRCTTA